MHTHTTAHKIISSTAVRFFLHHSFNNINNYDFDGYPQLKAVITLKLPEDDDGGADDSKAGPPPDAPKAMSEAEFLAALQKVFEAVDDGSHTLNKAALKRILMVEIPKLDGFEGFLSYEPLQYSDEMFNRYDRDNNGKITREEFFNTFQAELRLRHLFAFIDIGHEQVVSGADIGKFLDLHTGIQAELTARAGGSKSKVAEMGTIRKDQLFNIDQFCDFFNVATTIGEIKAHAGAGKESFSETTSHGWEEHRHKDGYSSFHNRLTGESAWICPPELLKFNWRGQRDDKGHVYYFNSKTKRSIWEIPLREPIPVVDRTNE